MRGGNRCPEVIFKEDGSYLFPLRWAKNLTHVRGFDPNKLSEAKKEVVELFDDFGIMSVRDVLNLKGDVVTLWSYLGKGFFDHDPLFFVYSMSLCFLFKTCCSFCIKDNEYES